VAQVKLQLEDSHAIGQSEKLELETGDSMCVFVIFRALVPTSTFFST
jgi:hypothetical protein